MHQINKRIFYFLFIWAVSIHPVFPLQTKGEQYTKACTAEKRMEFFLIIRNGI